MRRVAVLALTLVAAGATAVVVAGSGSDGAGRLVFEAPQARFLTAGAEVRVAGVVVGRVVEAEPTPAGRARVELRIDDDRVWPLPRGTEARLRWGSTIAYTNRRVDLVAPARAGAPLVDGATIPVDDVTTNVEVDEVLGDFDPRTRRDLKRFLDESGPTVERASDDLAPALEAAPPTLDEVNAVLDELGADEQALDVLLGQTDRAVHAIQRANPGIGRLVSGAAGTLDAFGRHAGRLRDTLGHLPSTLDRTTRTLAHADATLLSANDLAKRLAPGVAELRRIASPLNRTLATVQDVGPDTRTTLATLRRAAPDLDPLLEKATRTMPRIERIGRELDEQGQCVRPFAPEIAGFASTWTSMNRLGDGHDKMFRGNFIVYPYGLTTPQNSAELLTSFPQLDYAFPRPPGISSGQPWFQPQCGLGPETLDPSKDPEAR